MKNQKGFTILEILLVIIVLAVLFWLFVTYLKPHPCDKYRYAPVTEVPQSCIEDLLK